MPSKMASFLVFIQSPFFPKINGALNQHPPTSFAISCSKMVLILVLLVPAPSQAEGQCRAGRWKGA